MKVCSGCGASSVEVLEPGLPGFRHLDFASLIGAGRYELCSQCGLVANAESAGHAIVDETFLSEEYATSGQTSGLVQVGGEKITRSAIQARWINRNFQISNWRILDIGCFDGALLKEVALQNVHAELHGYDVNPHLAEDFRAHPGIQFHSGDLGALEGPFDLVISSHSLIYVPDLRVQLARVRGLLSDRGVFFVQTPDISTNPYSLTLGDQRYYFTASNLSHVLAQNGFIANPLELPEFPREAICLATGSDEGAKRFDPVEEVSEIFSGLQQIRDKLTGLPQQKISVLGTTINAAFVDAVLGAQLVTFVDENEQRIGKTFRGKPVVKPEDLESDSLLVLPFGESGATIQTRMANRIKAEMLLV
jgi:hypothetical protein